MAKILYHGNCTDGSGAALATWLKIGEHDHEYIPVQYGTSPFDLECEIAGQDIILVDFSFKRDVLIELSKVASYIVIIDHHVSAEKDLKGLDKELDNIEINFDMTKSGAYLAWEYFHPNTEVPWLIKHISDRDIWKFELEGTKDVIAGLSLISDWREWECYINDPVRINELEDDGIAINKFLDIQQDIIVKTPPIDLSTINKDFPKVMAPVYNLQGFMISDTLHKALEKYPEAPFAVAYFDLVKDKKRIVSLRSRNGSDVDVSEIAVKFGGGGHKHAAGFSIELS